MLIQTWRPWEQSTGPKTPEGKAKVAQNSYKGAEREVLRRLARVLRRCDSRLFAEPMTGSDSLIITVRERPLWVAVSMGRRNTRLKPSILVFAPEDFVGAS